MTAPARFRHHIQPLFNEEQRGCMLGYLDLWSYDDVRSNASLILTRVSDHSMPDDESGPWPDEWIALFKRWIDEGCIN